MEKEFDGYHEFGQKVESENSELREKIYMLYKEYLGTHAVNKAEIGCRVGRLLCDHLELLYGKKSNLDAEDIKAIESIYTFYRKIMGEAEFMAVENGFLAEFAVAKSLRDDAGFKVFAPTEREDLLDKVDLWVDLEVDQKTVLAVQVKCISGVSEPQMINLFKQKEIGGFYDKYGHLIKNPQGFSTNVDTMKEKSRSFANVTPIMIVLPSPESDQACFNAKTGKPDRKLGEYLYEEIESKFMALEEVAA